jgi:hypothetical protein
LLKTALLIAAEERRTQRRARAVGDAIGVDELPDPQPLPDAALEARRHRELLDIVLDSLDAELRTVFVLFELEGWSSAAIAELLGIPVGTVASRLRRARESFHAEARRLRARRGLGGVSYMTDPPRLLEEADAFERALLDSATVDVGSARVKARCVALLVSTSAIAGTTGASAVAATATTVAREHSRTARDSANNLW